MSVWSPEVNVDNPVVLDPSSTVSVSNFPATQPVSGTVSVGNFPATQPVSGSVSISGSVSVSNFPATQPVSGPLTDAQLRATPVPVATTPVVASSATVAQVVLSSNTNATALAANANRKRLVLYAPKSTLYIKFGATASATSFTYIVTAASTTLEIAGWVGQIDVLSTVNQTINVTELD